MTVKRTLAIILVFLGLFLALPASVQAAAELLYPPKGFELWPAARPMSDLRFLDARGKTVALSAFRGKIVVLNLWATWCPPCGAELPSLDRLQKQLGPQGLVVLAVSLDMKGEKLVGPFYREHGIENLGLYFDPAMSLTKELKLRGVPASVVIGRDGWEIGRYEGETEWTGKEMVVFLRRLLEAH